MIKLKKNINKLFFKKKYNFFEALYLLKKNSNVNFIESINFVLDLGIKINKDNKNIRNLIILPYGFSRNVIVAVLAVDIDLKLLKESGADYYDSNNIIKKIKKKQIFFDVLISSFGSINLLNEVSHILVPLGLMPNVNNGTITNDIFKAIKKIKFCHVFYNITKNGLFSGIIGKINFDSYKLKKNFLFFLKFIFNNNLLVYKKKSNIKKLILSSTMGLSFLINI